MVLFITFTIGFVSGIFSVIFLISRAEIQYKKRAAQNLPKRSEEWGALEAPQEAISLR